MAFVSKDLAGQEKIRHKDELHAATPFLGENRGSLAESAR
jgi:hypothetical protein